MVPLLKLQGRTSRVLTRESSQLEFKESFNWLSKDKYGRSVASFANNKGGLIVFGVRDKPRELVGLGGPNFEGLDEAKITQYLNSMFSPEISFEKEVITLRGRTIGILRVVQSDQKPIVSLRNDGEIKEGEIYYRYNARSERIKFPELKSIFDEIRQREREEWMRHLEKISQVGATNVAILDFLNGEIRGEGGTLVIDRKLVPKLKFIKEGAFKESGYPILKLIGEIRPVPVMTGPRTKQGLRITEDVNAPLVRVKEESLLEQYPLHYYDLVKELRHMFSDFKLNAAFYSLMQSLKGNKSLCRVRHLDPSNPKSQKQYFYHPRILKEFEKHFTKK